MKINIGKVKTAWSLTVHAISLNFKKRIYSISVCKPVTMDEGIEVLKEAINGGKQMTTKKPIRRNDEGKFSDKLNYSGEPDERRYVRKVAKNWLPKLQSKPYKDKIEITVGQLQRLCEYIDRTEVVRNGK